MIDGALFRRALGSFPAGVTVVSVRGDDGWQGITVSAFSSVSLDPPLVAVNIGMKARAHAHLVRAGRFGVSILAEDQAAVSNHFAGYGPASFDWEPFGEVHAIAGAAAHLDCAVTQSVTAGDHTVFIARVEAARVEDRPALVYWRGKYRRMVEP